MDYQQFYNEIVQWINQVNQKASQFGMENSEFWNWVMKSVTDFEIRYNKNKLVIKQMVMLVQWLEDIYYENKGR